MDLEPQQQENGFKSQLIHQMIQTGGTRGLFMGGATPSDTDTIDYINIDTTGNAIDFGNLTSVSARYW